MEKPRFSTLVKQATEQCREKGFFIFEGSPDNQIIAMFFASGMEYRLSHEHVKVERGFLSSADQNEFLLGYLQGKDADARMISIMEEECRQSRYLNNESIYYTKIFTEGIFYEESILEKKEKNN